MKQKQFINLNKGITFLVILGMMAIYQRWDNPTAWIYLALHGTYGILWNLKSQLFPDRQWEQKTTLWFGLAIFAGLALYWIAPWMLIARDVQALDWYVAVCVSMNLFGTFLHIASDMQKYTELKLNPHHLIQSGCWRSIRNPNYFGELLIYLSFSLLAMHWLPLVILATWVLFVWLPKMHKKDASLARYPDFSAYKARTKLFIPFIF